MNRVQRARRRVNAANDELNAAMREMFPPGKRTRYSLGDYWIGCKVIVVFGDRVRVIGETRGKVYWVSGFRFVGSAYDRRAPSLALD